MADRVHPNAAGKKASANANSNSDDNINPTANAPPFPSTKSQLYGASRPTFRPQPHNRRRSTCCSICIWLTAIIVTVIVLIAVASTVVYLIYRPHRPSFSVTALKIDSFKFTPNSQLNSKFDLNLAATNPNKKVKFIYSPISVAISSNGVDLGDGSFPEFVHEKRNITAMKVTAISSGGEIEGEPVDSLKAAIKSKAGLPLEIKVETKVKVKMGWLKMPKVGLRVLCDGITAGVPMAKKKTAVAAAVDNAECKEPKAEGVSLSLSIWTLWPLPAMYRVVSRLASSTSRKLVCSRVTSSRSYAAKDINFGNGARAAMLQGVSEIAEAVKVTMGPKGRNVIIDKSHGSPKVTKDGVTVAKSIQFKDKAKNVGADLVKQVASATNTAAGDGTTCATVLTQAILTEGCKSIAAGVSVMDLRIGIKTAVDAVISELKSKALMISTPEEITQVATISANGEREIGELIARAMEKVGREGVITVSDGNTLEDELEVVEGMKLGRGFISPYFINDQKTQKCDLENPLILIHEKKISDMNLILRVLELAVEKKRSLLVVAEDVESDALAMLILNKHHAGLKVCAIKAPGFGDNRKANLDDLAILTGGEVITDERGLTLDKVQVEMLGTAKKVTVSLDDTIILHGGGDKKLIEERCEQLRTTIDRSTAMFDKEKAQERLSKLSGGVAVFKVGGVSEAEVGERKDRVTDAVNATRAAVEEGIVPGGGAALLHATKVLDDLQAQNADQKRGIEIVQHALRAPTFTIVSNAGYDGALVLGKLLEQDDRNLGYDAAKGVYVDMVKAGIVDPLKVVRTALVDAASISMLLTTAEAAIVEDPNDKNKLPSRMPAMDDMGY
ncbi:chaperonin CPN60-like 2, mitochondrial [Cucurbita pepo subsp. pepo]|uniref:chaperonin CPN60-like 2, mitochondrial n=1 Tax=Cucurbita pepo subsp. pepo TaxID=3664 RepID=UPI000C9D6B01|nr:chaperonin CPN60-like 2, mitochondrial [Cucurbita pepo subsp. pepo]